jgi:outer membrane protein assembly factor BamA
MPRHTLFLRLSGVGAWNTVTPFQLTLGGDRNLRGYREERFPGGRRIVMNAEDRIYFGWPFREALDVGGTVFVDVGRVWPGDVPFGIDSNWRATAGFGLRGSFPAGGRSTFRIDVAMPLDHPSFSNYRLIISASELLGLSATQRAQDAQLLRSRSEGVAGELFRISNQ